MDALDNDSPPPMGHNQPPSDLGLLKERLAELTRELDADIAGHEGVLQQYDATRPELETDDHAAKAGNFVKMLRETEKKVDEAFKPAKAPYLEMTRTVDDHFGALRIRLRDIRVAIQARLDRFTRRQEEERRKQMAENPVRVQEDRTRVRSDHGALVTSRKTYDVEVVDFAAVPDEFKLLDAKKALQVLKAKVPITGLKLVEGSKAEVR